MSLSARTLLLMRRALVCLLLPCFAACTLTSSGAGSEEYLAMFDWLPGEWRARTGQTVTVERWQRTARDTFAGIGLSEDPGTGEQREFERLELTARSGRWQYIATVAHNAGPIAFDLVSSDQDRMVFENLAHDFPRRIVYLQRDENHYRVEASDARDDGGRGFALDFTRVKNP